ncbi:hypothetical protein AXF42_Ash019423 [Apostasia shenzhenica]|uniref:Ycf3-interacting protein 1, chloroplastic n=1 Tax=Apostasia shenzhenica TaxID=1088818 RepID=A0A2I0B4W7_9ASPA|nr:hypothetical protein AXF42_Ash019423 [Apostasia shenzhenica]
MALLLPLASREVPTIFSRRIPSKISPLHLGSSLHIASVMAPSHLVLCRKVPLIAAVGEGQTEVEEQWEKQAKKLSVPGEEVEDQEAEKEKEDDVSVSYELDKEASPEDLEYVGQIKRVLELLKKNRDMIFGEIKLTIMIEDPRDAERKRLLGIENPDELTRDDLAAALEDIHEGRIPKNRLALQLLAEEMVSWPDLEIMEGEFERGSKHDHFVSSEVEGPKTKRNKSLYARVTDTGVDPREAAKRLNVDWDLAADIGAEEEVDDEIEVPPAVILLQLSMQGYGALYLVTALPLLIGVSVEMKYENGFIRSRSSVAVFDPTHDLNSN